MGNEEKKGRLRAAARQKVEGKDAAKVIKGWKKK